MKSFPFLISILIAVGSCSNPTTIVSPVPSTEAISSAPTSTPIPIRNAEIDVLWVSSDNPSQGGISPAYIEITDSSMGVLALGISETQPSGAGDLWATSGWMAALKSSLLMGEDLSDYDLEITVEGKIDGPSAGAIMTIGFVSLLRGDPIKANVAMTGGINPDGTISPVGGIPEKLEGAYEEGKDLVLIPLGQLSGEVLDKKNQLNIDVREVGDIYEAYEIITGTSLPKPKGSEDIQPQLESKDFQKINSKAKDWQSRYLQEKAELSSIPQSSVSEVAQRIQEIFVDASDIYEKSQRYLEQGEVAGAYLKAIEATASITIATETARLLDTAEHLNPNAIEENLESSWESSKTRIDALIDRLSVVEPESASDAVALAQAYSNLAVAQGLLDFSQETFNRSFDKSELESLIWITFAPALANLQAQVANDLIDLGVGGGDAVSISSEDLEGFAQVLENSARTNLDYFERYVLEQVAQELGLNAATVKVEFPNFDLNYAFAVSALKALPYLKEQVGSNEQQHYATLGASLGSYYFSSILIAKYVSLEANVDDSAQITSFNRERSLVRVLDFAEKRTRESIALAKATNNDPILLVIDYDSAKLEREGKPQDKMEALGALWNASLSAELMAIFSGKFELP